MALQAANLGSFTFGQKTYAVTADFDNIGGLKARAAVKSAGVVVGRVRSIVFDPETFQARVVMDMDARYPFPDDSSAKILTAGLLGEQYVGIEAGADEANLVEGSKFAVRRVLWCSKISSVNFSIPKLKTAGSDHAETTH